MAKTAGQNREDLTPDAEDAWRAFSKAFFAPGVLDARTKQLIAVAVAHSHLAFEAFDGDKTG